MNELEQRIHYKITGEQPAVEVKYNIMAFSEHNQSPNTVLFSSDGLTEEEVVESFETALALGAKEIHISEVTG